MNLLEQEALRARWRRALDGLVLDRTERDDFGRSILARRLRNITVQMALLPADPEANVVSIDETFSSWLDEQRVVDLDGVSFTLPQVQRRTAHALTLVDAYGDEWSQYFALHRSGTVEVGAGDHGGWDWRNHQDERVRSIALTPTVARVWTMLKLAALVHERHEFEAPLLLAVGVVDTSEALLAILGEGWAEPDDVNNNVGTCGEPHLLWHLELPTVPGHSLAREVAFSVGDRLEDAWGG